MDSKRRKKQKISNYLLKKRKRALKQIQLSSTISSSNYSNENIINYSEIIGNFKQFLGFNWQDPSFSKDIKHLSI